jgi:hypothetical protein
MTSLKVKENINGKVGAIEMSRNRNSFAEDWLPVNDIQNSMIITTNKEKITGVKITPRNIFILEQNAQNNIMIGLKNFYNTIDYEFWLVVADRPVDLSVYLSQMQLLYNEASTPAIRKIISQDIDKAYSFINENIVDTEYYLLFKEKDTDILQKRVRMVINGLAGCGLNAQQVSNDDLRVIMDNFLNGGKKFEFKPMVMAA